MMHRSRFLLLAAASCALGWTLPAGAQSDYPSRPVTILTPFPAGGVVDIVARLFNQELAKRLGQQFIVETRPGAGAMLAMRAVKNAPPDGHTLLLHTSGLTIAQTVLKKPDFDVRKDYAPISIVLEGELGFWVTGALPVKTMKELIDYARKNPGKLNYGSPAIGSATHLSTATVASKTNVDMVHVPYGGGPKLINALVAGEVHVLMWNLTDLAQQGTKVKLLAVASKERASIYPDVPTLAEAGIDFSAPFWMGYFAPAGTPQPVIAKLNSALKEALQTPDIQRHLKNQSWKAIGSTPEATRRTVAAEVEQWMATVKTANIPLAD